MAGNIEITEFATEMMKICTGYVDGIKEGSEKAAKEAANYAAEILRETSPKSDAIFTDHYADEWAVSSTRSSGEVVTTVHNKEYPLTHLLEDGHVIKKGGRSPALPHIGPAAEKAQAVFEQKESEVIKRGKP